MAIYVYRHGSLDINADELVPADSCELKGEV
jgi:hypothetical protein